MPTNVNSFENGLDTNSPKERQPNNTYRYLLNAVDSSDSGDQLKITSEKGTTEFCTNLPEGTQHGKTVLNSDKIIFTVNGEVGQPGYECHIGVINYLGVYEDKVVDPSLNFDVNFPIQAEARKIYNGHRIVYFTDNKNPVGFVDLDSTEPFSIINANLLGSQSLPIVNFVEFTNGSGALFTGVYQFIARYLADDFTPSSFGFETNVVPVLNEVREVGRNEYDGAPIDTPLNNKNIRLQLSNLDVTKPNIELVYITYKGLAQTPEIRSFYRGPVTGVTMDITFTGLETTTELTLEEVVAEYASYVSAKTIAQKDNRLFLANLTTRPDPNLQTIANNILLSYDIEEQLYEEDNTAYFDDYKGEKQTVDKKTYMREEAYAFAFQIIYKDGTRSFAYHIPASIPQNNWVSAQNYGSTFPVAFNPNTSTIGQKFYSPFTTDGSGNKTNLPLGTYISAEVYEDDKDYPVDGPQDLGGNSYVRFHVMPPLDKEPHFRSDGTDQYIRFLRIRATVPLFSSLSQQEQDQIAGYVILRADRTLQNRSIVSQGIYQRTARMTSLDLPGLSGTPYPFGEEFYTEVPGFNNFFFTMDGTSETNNDAAFLAEHDYLPSGAFNDQGLRTFNIANPDYYDDGLITYYSSDFILGNIPLTPNKIKEKLIIEGTWSVERSQITPNDNYSEDNGDPASPGGNEDQFSFSMLCNYTGIQAGRNLSHNVLDSYYFKNETQQIETTYKVNSKNIYEHFATPHYTFDTSATTNDLFIGGDSIVLGLNMTQSGLSADEFNDSITPNNGGLGLGEGLSRRALINLENPQIRQYGVLANLEYLPVLIVSDRLNPVLNAGSLVFYNGDIFISKVAFLQSYLAPIQVNAQADTGSREKRPIDNWGDQKYKGIPIMSMSYFFTESVVNSNYRHEVPNGVIYYPKSEIGTIIGNTRIDPALGHSTGYNLLYSRNNTIRPAYERPLGNSSQVSRFENRIIYSQQAFESEISDSYRLFLPNNFHDIPKNKGEIWKIFVNNNSLFAHTPRSLWRTFVNEQTALKGGFDESSIYLGNGGLFPMPSREIVTLQGGFGGTISQFAGHNTPYGYIFPDILQGKLFRLAGENIEDISGEESVWFNANLESFYDGKGQFIDNPYKANSKGIVDCFDSYKKRYIFTYQNSTSSYTKSYSFLIGKWRSYHSYTPNVYISHDNRMFAINNSLADNIVHEHGTGEYLEFYNQDKSNLELHFIISANGLNINPDNIYVNLVNLNEVTGVLNKQRQFNTIQVLNDNQNSGILEIVTSNSFITVNKNQVHAHFKNNEYRLAIPNNGVINDAVDINNPANLVTSLPLNSPNRLYKDRINGKYALVKLIYNPLNTENNKISINYIQNEFREKTL